MSKKISVELSDIEYENLKYTLGDFKRVTRDSYYRFVKTDYEYSKDLINKERHDAALNLYKKLVEDIREDNKI